MSSWRTLLAAFAPLAFLAFVAGLSVPAAAQTTITVTTTADSGAGSLRQAILDANAIAPGTPVTIAFAIPGAGPHVIAPATILPAITRGTVAIDGYTQPGATPNTLPLGRNDAVLKIQLDGYGALTNGLTYARFVSGNLLRGLSITRFNFAAIVQDSSVFGGGGGNVFVGNWFGFAPDGTPQPGQRAFYLVNAAQTIGQAGADKQNLIVSSNTAIEGLGLATASIVNNAFGVRPDGTPLPAGQGYFGNQPVVLGAFMQCCPDLPFTAKHFVGSPTDGGNLFAGMSGIVLQAGEGATFHRNRVIAPAVDALFIRDQEPRPAIASVAFGNGSTVIAGSFAGTSVSQDMRLEFHATNAPDPNQRGAADEYLGARVVTADASGNGSYAFTAAGDRRYFGVWKTRVSGGNTSLPATYVGPALSASPSPVVLAAATGDTAAQVVTITNGGTSFVTFGTLAVSGAGLSLASDACSGQTVSGSGGTCTVGVQFAPGATGLVEGTLSAPVANAGVPVTTAIATTFLTDVDATGTPAALTLAVTPIGTGEGTVSSATPAPVIDCVRAAGANSGNCASSYPPGSTISLAASPANGSSFAFWSGACGGTSPACVVTLDAAKDVTAAFVSGVISTGGTVAMTISAPDGIALGESLTVTVTLAGTPPGAVDGTVTFFNGSSALCPTVQPVVANAASCTVTPTSTAPLAVWATYSGSPTYLPAQSLPKAVDVTGGAGASLALDFGAQPLGVASPSRTVLVGNPTGGTLGLVQLAATGDFSATHACPAALAPGESCPVALAFVPAVAGVRTGTFSAITSSPSATAQVALAGVGVEAALAPQLGVSPSILVFGNANVGSSGPTLSVTVANSGAGAAQGLTVTGGGDFALTNGCGATLAAGASCTVAVRFEPSVEGAVNASLQVAAANAPALPAVVLAGTGVAVPRVRIRAQPAAVVAATGVPTPITVKTFRNRVEANPFRVVEDPVGNVRVDWQVVSASGRCLLSAASSTSGSDGNATAGVTALEEGVCTVRASSAAAPVPVPPDPLVMATADIVVDARDAQSRATLIDCEGDATAADPLSYVVPQATGTLNAAFVVRNGYGEPVQGVQVDRSGPAGGGQSVTDSLGRATFALSVGQRAAGDLAVVGTVAGTSNSATCRIRVTQSPGSLASAAGTVLPEHLVNGAGEFIGARSGRFCAVILDRAGNPLARPGETIRFAGPATQPTVAFSRPGLFDGITDATGVACSPTATLSLKGPADPYEFDVIASHEAPDPDLAIAYRLKRTVASQTDVDAGTRRMSALNAIQSGVVGAAYPQELCVVLTESGPGQVYCTNPPPGRITCDGTVRRGIANVPVACEVLSPPTGASVGLRPAGGSGAGVENLGVTTAAAVPTPVFGGLEYRSTGRACVSALSNASTGVAYVRATSSVGTVLFTLTNVTAQPSAVATGASTVTVPLEGQAGQPVTVQVKSAAGLPIAGVLVNFSIRYDATTQGVLRPTLMPGSTTTDGLGLARTVVRANGYSDPFRVVATVLLPVAAAAGPGATGSSVENGVFEVEFLVMPFAATDPGADPGGDADGDGIPNGVEIAQGTYALDKDNDVFASARLFAMQQYRDFLGREGEAGGIAYYTDALGADPNARAPIIEAFFNSPEFSGTVSPIVRLYFATFLRLPDYGGLLFQVDALRSGTPLTVIAGNFTLSPEFQATYGALNDTQYVTLLYQNILGRTPVQAEIDFHVARLSSGVTRGEVLVGFSESPEYQANTFNEVYVTMMYVGMLRRAPEQAGFDYWLGYMDAGNPGLALVAGFLNAPEYRGRFLP